MLLVVAAAGCHAELREREGRTEPADAPFEERWHRVGPGERLADIAALYGVSVELLAVANAVGDPDRLPEGLELYVPDPDAPPPTRAPAPWPGRHARTIAPPADAPEPGPAEVDPVEGRLVWPVVGPISSPFGLRDGRLHQGIDVAVPDGTEVRAAEAGRVIYAGDKIRGYGRLIILKHDANLVTLYAHNEELFVSEGQTVARGDLISRSGHTGHVTAPHLHFEVREANVPRDPAAFLDPAP